MLSVSGKLCSPRRRFVRRLHGGLRRRLHQRRALRAPYPDTNRNDHADTQPDDHADADQYDDSDEYADSQRNRHKHTWGERLLSVRRLLRGSDRRYVWRVPRGVWSVLYGRRAVHLSNAAACHPDADPNSDQNDNRHSCAHSDPDGDAYAHQHPQRYSYPHINQYAPSDRDRHPDRYAHTKPDCHAYPDRDTHEHSHAATMLRRLRRPRDGYGR